MDAPSKEDLKEWRHSYVTRHIVDQLREEREEIKENIACGLYTGDTVDKTAQLLAKAIGQCEQLEDVIHAIETAGDDDES